ARIVAELPAGHARRRGARDDRVCGDHVASVTDDAFTAAKGLPLDALEGDREALLASIILRVDPEVERVAAADDDAEIGAALEDVRVDEAASRDLCAKGLRLLVRPKPPEHRLEPADELDATTSVCAVGTSRRRTRSKRGNGDPKDA